MDASRVHTLNEYAERLASIKGACANARLVRHGIGEPQLQLTVFRHHGRVHPKYTQEFPLYLADLRTRIHQHVEIGVNRIRDDRC
jgi:hypothetical protein